MDLKRITPILLLILLFISMETNAQNTPFTISKDTVHEGLIYNGTVTFDNLEQEKTFEWLREGFKEYSPEGKALNYLQFYLKNYSLILFLGTWCDDSHYLVPRLEKVLKLIQYPLDELMMYAVDRTKVTKDGANKIYNLVKVPTLIVLKNGKEVGRITENVSNSVEADLAAIVAKDNGQ